MHKNERADKINEEQIRPKMIFDTYLDLAKKDAKQLFTETSFESTKCPACEQDQSFTWSFIENFHYNDCCYCKTIYVNPRPKKEAVHTFYEEGLSVKYWASDFYKKTKEQRIEKLWRPKALQVLDLISKYAPDCEWVCDVGAGYGLFLEVFQETAQKYKKNIIAIEPSPFLAQELTEKGIPVIIKLFEDVVKSDLPSGPGIFVCFELFEHLRDPKEFLITAKTLMESNSLFILTTLSGMGLDIRELGKNSKSVHPPHHLNFLNPKSMRLLLERIGFSPIEIATPGKLDFDILKNNYDILPNGFLKDFISYADSTELEKAQKWLQEANLSSHMMVSFKKF